MLKKPEERTLWQQLFANEKDDAKKKQEPVDSSTRRREVNPIEEGIRRARERGARQESSSDDP